MAYVGQVTGANQWIAPDLQTYPASYIIHEDNSTYYAQGFGGLPNQSGTDAATVIQGAINNLPSGGGKLFFKAGHYNLTNQTSPIGDLPYCGLNVNKPLTIDGEGIDIVKFQTGAIGATGAYFVFLASNSPPISGVTIRNITLDAPDYVVGAGAKWDIGIWFKGISNVVLENVKMNNCGWRFDGSSTSWSDTYVSLSTDAKNIFIKNVYVNKVLGSCTLAQVRNVQIEGGLIYQGQDDPLLILGAGQAIKINNLIIDGPDVIPSGAASGGIYLLNDGSLTTNVFAVSDIKITNTTIRKVVSGGSGVALLNVANVSITDCTLKFNSAHGVTNMGGGSKAKDIKIIGNTISENSNFGILFAAEGVGAYFRDIAIKENQIYENANEAIHLDSTISGAVTRINILGNETYGQNGNARGLRIESDQVLTNINVQGNIFADTNPFTTNLWSGGVISSGMIRDNVGIPNQGTSPGTGAQQTIAHGLSATPTNIVLTPRVSGMTLYESQIPDATNIYITATNTNAYYWKAEF